MVERYVKPIKEQVGKVVSSLQRDCEARLHIFLFAYRTSIHDTTGVTPAR
jgi:hypothetical protein